MRSLGKGILFGCGTLLALGIVVGVIIAVILSAGGGEEEASGPGTSRQNPIPVGETAEIGGVSWTVTDARTTTELSSEFETLEGNFVVVDVSFMNNSDEVATLDSGSLAIVDSEGNTNEASTDASLIVDPDMDTFLSEVNPGVTQDATVAFEVAPNAEGLVLRANDAQPLSENYVFMGLGL